jgi:hypothetical protein
MAGPAARVNHKLAQLLDNDHKPLRILLVKPSVRQYLQSIGRRGGRASRRALSPETARDMVRVREARRAFRRFQALCFWSCDPSYQITLADVPWVARQLKTHGGRAGWEMAAKLCR